MYTQMTDRNIAMGMIVIFVCFFLALHMYIHLYIPIYMPHKNKNESIHNSHYYHFHLIIIRAVWVEGAFTSPGRRISDEPKILPGIVLRA